MFSISPQRFHSLLIAPLLLPLLFFGGSSSSNDLPAPIDTNYDAHGTLYGSFPFSQPFRIVKTGEVSHGELRVFGPFNGFSQDSFIYLPNDGYVGTDSFTYHACDSSGNCVDGTIDIDVVNSAPHAVDDNYAVHGHSGINAGGGVMLYAGPHAGKVETIDYVKFNVGSPHPSITYRTYKP